MSTANRIMKEFETLRELPKCDTKKWSEQMVVEKWHWQTCLLRSCHRPLICRTPAICEAQMKCREIRYACFVTKFLLRTFFLLHPTSSGILWFHFCFSKYFYFSLISSLIHCLFGRVWFNFLCICKFSSFTLVTEFQFHLTVVRDDAWYYFSLEFFEICIVANIWSILEIVPSAVEKNVCSVLLDWMVYYVCRTIWSLSLFESVVYLFST